MRSSEGSLILGIVMLAVAMFGSVPVALNLPGSWPGGVLVVVVAGIGIALIRAHLKLGHYARRRTRNRDDARGTDAAIPTSIKGVLLVDGGVVLVKNGRNEWELPGGRTEPGEAPESTLAREFGEELSVRISVGAPIDSYVFEVVPERHVRILTYGCTLAGSFAPRISNEHTEYCVCPVDELNRINLPEGYRRSVETWAHAV